MFGGTRLPTWSAGRVAALCYSGKLASGFSVVGVSARSYAVHRSAAVWRT